MYKLTSLRPDPRLAEMLAEYPTKLFNEKLYQGIELADRYCLDLAIDLLQRLGVTRHLEVWCTTAELCQALNFSPRFQATLAWLLERLATSQLILVQKRDGIRHYRSGDPWYQPELDSLYAVGLAIDPANSATLDLLKAAGAAYLTLAKGESSGEELLLKGHLDLWLAYFRNRNPLYAVNNWVSASASIKHLSGKPALRIVEVGAGAGSGTEALLTLLIEHNLTDRLEHYLVTEPSSFLRRRSERELKAKFKHLPLEFGSLDINKPWADQGAAKAGFDLVYGVNTLHIANDLLFSLREARSTLTPDGWLVAGECLRPFPGQPIYIELVFQLLNSFTDVTTNPDFRPNPGFLTHQQWQRAFTKAGFKQIQIRPDQEQIRKIYPRFLTGAICGRH